MKLLSIRAKLTLSFSALFALVLVTMGGLFYHTVRVRLDRQVNEGLGNFSIGLWGYMKFGDSRPTLAYDPEDHEVLFFVRTAARYYQIYDARDGRILGLSEDSQLMHLSLSPAEVIRFAQNPGFDEMERSGVRLRFRSAVFRAGAHPYLLRVGVPLKLAENTRQQMVTTFLILFLPGGFLAGLAGWCMAGNVLKPVEELRTVAHQIGISQLNHRLPLRGTRDELDLLAETFNEVFSRLEEAVGQMKKFTTSISHELRTPLASLQGEAEMALMRPDLPEQYRHVLVSQLEEFQKLSRLINRLLELARAETGQIQLTNQELELSELLCSLSEQMEPVAASKGVALELKCPAPIRLTGDAQWLERAVLNLIDNAIKFTPEHGAVRIEAMSGGEYALIQISDTGIGIPPEAIPHIFERFYRVDVSRSSQVEGVGLGLAIVKWIVEAHHGTIQVKSETGVGTCFIVRLPLAAPSGAAGHDYLQQKPLLVGTDY